MADQLRLTHAIWSWIGNVIGLCNTKRRANASQLGQPRRHRPYELLMPGRVASRTGLRPVASSMAAAAATMTTCSTACGALMRDSQDSHPELAKC
jgi:hypothetical protein